MSSLIVPDGALAGEIEAVAVAAAREAGRLLAGRFGSPLDVEYKDDRNSDPVTDVDRESEALIRRAVAGRYPDHGFLGEEGSEEGDAAAPDFVWAVDPLDGTKNYLHGLPIYACSIGVLYRGAPVAAALYIPWPGRSGRGGASRSQRRRLFPRGDRLTVFAGTEPEGQRLTALPGMFRGAFRVDRPMRGKLGEVRNTGSIAYDLALTAQGVLQYCLTGGGRIWDVAAGALLVQEAGGAALVARRFRNTGVLGSSRVHWTELGSFYPQWEAGKTSLKQMRGWSEPMVLGDKRVADFVAGNLRRRWGLKRRLRQARRSLRGRRPTDRP